MDGKVLVTGGAGLIGSNLCRALIKRGYTVSCIDNLSFGNMYNLEDLLDNPRFTFIHADVRDEEKLCRAAEDAYGIFHLAALKIPILELKRCDVIKANLLGTFSVLEVAKDIGAKVIFASTSDVYGKSLDMPFREDGDLTLGSPTVPRWAYAASKMVDEHLCMGYYQDHGVPVVILRYFNVYGPGHDLSPLSGGPQALFIDAILNNRGITIYGDGNQSRAFCYIDDAVEATIASYEVPEAVGEIFNIGNDKGVISIKDLAKLIYEIIDPACIPNIKYISHQQAFGTYEEVLQRKPDLSKARQILGYEPCISNTEGLQRTVEWHKRLMGLKSTDG